MDGPKDTWMSPRTRGWAQGHVDGPKDTSKTIQIAIIIRYYFNYAMQEKSSGVHAKETIQANSLLSYRLLKANLKKPEYIYRLPLFKQTIAPMLRV